MDSVQCGLLKVLLKTTKSSLDYGSYLHHIFSLVYKIFVIHKTLIHIMTDKISTKAVLAVCLL